MADELGWERFSLMGYSMGVKVAHQVLLQTQHRVRRLVGVNPVPAAEVPMDELAWALFHGAAGEPANRAAIIDFTTGSRCYRPRYLNIQRLNCLWTIRHSSARIAGNLIT